MLEVTQSQQDSSRKGHDATWADIILKDCETEIQDILVLFSIMLKLVTPASKYLVIFYLGFLSENLNEPLIRHHFRVSESSKSAIKKVAVRMQFRDIRFFES